MLKIAWSDLFAHSLPANHRFPMAKYDLLPQQLLHEGTIEKSQLFAPEPLSEDVLLLTHDQHYWHRLKNLELTKQEIRRTGFPHSSSLIHRELCIMEGTRQSALFALEHGVSLNVAGGTHHAYADRGEGFCLLNDIAIGSNFLLDQQLVDKILIIDLDVHQGNGTASLFEEEPRVFTFSMHGGKNYPMHKEQSDLDVPLPDGMDDAGYLTILKKHLDALFERTHPDFVFFQSGVDVLATDKLGRLSLSLQGCRERDRLVIQACRDHQLPLQISMGGGYSDRLVDIVEAHANTFRLANDIYF